MKIKFPLLLLIVVTILVIGFFIKSLVSSLPKSSSTKSQALNQSAVNLSPPPVRPTDPQRGSSTAPVTIIEFADFSCPYCAQAQPLLNKVLNNYQAQVKVVWKDFPLSNYSFFQTAHLAARCAQSQGKFWQYHDSLFANQGNFSREFFTQLAARLDLDLSQFNRCLDRQENLHLVKQSLQDGQRAGVDGVPFFFIGQTRMNQLPTEDELARAIEQELERLER